MRAIEKVGMFLYTSTLDASNREIQERFQHPGETISRYFNEVLRIVSSFALDVIKPKDFKFVNIQLEIVMNPSQILHFKVTLIYFFIINNLDSFFPNYLEINASCFLFFMQNCIEVINCTHVCACVSIENQISFIGIKGVPIQKVMVACSFDMQFMFVQARQEGSANDTRISLKAISNPNIKFPN